jgi:hypothetical protein
VCLLVQWFGYLGAGVLVNYQALLGAEPRVFSSVFRPSGLFLEPSAYSISTVCLLALRMRVDARTDMFIIAGLATTLITLSLFGFLAALGFVTYYYWRSPYFRLGAIAVAMLLALQFKAVLSSGAATALTSRGWRNLADVGKDQSITQRYPTPAEMSRMFQRDPTAWFGNGVSNDYIEQWGASGYGFLLGTVGLVGTVGFMLALRGLAPEGARHGILFAPALVMVAAPLWTMFFWWAFLGWLCHPSTGQSHTRNT